MIVEKPSFALKLTGFRNQLYGPKFNYQHESTTTDFTSTNTSLEKSLDSSSDSTQLTAYHKLTRKEGPFATQLHTEHKEPTIPIFKVGVFQVFFRVINQYY